jgi:HlyD family secretion protein
MKATSIWLLFTLAALSGFFAGCTPDNNGIYQGYIEGEYVYVASPLGGALTHLAVARGDQVQAGQLVFELEHVSESAAVHQAENNLATAQAQLQDLAKGLRPTEIQALESQLAGAQAGLKLAEVELGRREKLGGQDVMSKEELDQARSQRDTAKFEADRLTADLATARLGGRADAIAAAQASVDAQQSQLEKVKWSLDQKQQSAPTNAIVQDTLFRQGEWVAAGSPVLVLLPPANLKTRFFVPEPQLNHIRIGGVADVTIDGNTNTTPATISYVSTQPEFTPPVLYNEENRAKLVFMVEARFAPSDSANLHPGQPVDVKLRP